MFSSNNVCIFHVLTIFLKSSFHVRSKGKSIPPIRATSRAPLGRDSREESNYSKEPWARHLSDRNSNQKYDLLLRKRVKFDISAPHYTSTSV